jgi:hypothetical protein
MIIEKLQQLTDYAVRSRAEVTFDESSGRESKYIPLNFGYLNFYRENLSGSPLQYIRLQVDAEKDDRDLLTYNRFDRNAFERFCGLKALPGFFRERHTFYWYINDSDEVYNYFQPSHTRVLILNMYGERFETISNQNFLDLRANVSSALLDAVIKRLGLN